MKLLLAILIIWWGCKVAPLSGAMPGWRLDSLTSPEEAAFVRACYLATGASLSGDETVSSMLTVLWIGRWALLSAEQVSGLQQVRWNVYRRYAVVSAVRRHHARR